MIFKKITRGGFLASVIAGGYTVGIERYLLQINHYHFNSKRLPKSFDGIKIAVLADLHYGLLMPEIWIQHVIQKINSIKAAILNIGFSKSCWLLYIT